jgi:hypothetical protein
MARLYNPDEEPLADRDVERTLSVQGEIEVLDPAGLVGISRMWTRTTVLDQDGNLIYSTPGTLPRSRSYRAPRESLTSSWIDSVVLPATEHFSVSIPLDPNLGYPSRLSRLEHSMGVLIADESRVVDIPFTATDEWIDVVPGLRLLVEKATADGTKYEYRAKFEYDPNQVSYSGGSYVHLRGDETVPPMVVTDIEVVDAYGVPVRDISNGGSFVSSTSGGGGDDLMTGTTIGSGNCSACGQAATIRYTFAVAAYEREVQFVFEDIPVPSL